MKFLNSPTDLMRAAVIGDGGVVLGDVPVPEIGENDALIRRKCRSS